MIKKITCMIAVFSIITLSSAQTSIPTQAQVSESTATDIIYDETLPLYKTQFNDDAIKEPEYSSYDEYYRDICKNLPKYEQSLILNPIITNDLSDTSDTSDTKDKLIIPPDSGEILTARKGVNYGPSGKETWYNLDMSGVRYLMNHLGYTYEEYPYWIREDGCKMFGDYIMVAADLNFRPKGTILECSLGTAMVVDTGDLEPYQLDIAVNWT